MVNIVKEHVVLKQVALCQLNKAKMFNAMYCYCSLYARFYLVDGLTYLLIELIDVGHVGHQQLLHHPFYCKNLQCFLGSLSFDAEDAGVAREPPMGGLVPGFP